MRRITLDIWSHVPAGKQVESGYNYKLTAPNEAGFYTLYQIVDDRNCYQGWEWELNHSDGEDKKAICRNLLYLLVLTRAGKDLTGCEYIINPVSEKAAEEYVVIRMKDGYMKRVCVTADSGIALIKDVISAL